MTQTLRRTAAAALTVAVVLTGAACSKETKGTATPSGGGDTSSSSKSDDNSTSSKSDSSTSSDSDKPAGAMSASDGSLSFDAPAGYQDAMSQVSVPGALAAVFDPSSDSAFPSHIVVSAESGTASLDQVLSTVRDQFKAKFNAPTEIGNPPISSVDGEDLRAWTSDAYKDGAQDVASAQIITTHKGKIYYFTVNTLPANRSTAGAALLDLVESVKWS